MAYIDVELRQPLYRDSTRLLKIERYAMQRYYAAWSKRHLKSAERFFYAADRAQRLLRIAAQRNRPAYEYNGRGA